VWDENQWRIIERKTFSKNMTPQQQASNQQARPAPVTSTRPAGGAAPKTDFERLMDEKVMIYSPFGAPEKDTIKLTVKIVQDLIAVPTKSGKTCSEADAIRFMMMCKARRLNPFEGDAYLIGYDTQNGPKFSLITAHQAFLKRAEVHAEYDGMTSGVILLDDGNIVEREGDFHLPGETVVGGWATVFLKNRSHPTTRKIRLERFNTNMAQWAKDPAGMIVKCSEADSLRSSFPTLVGGLYLDGEIEMDFGDISKINTSRPLFEKSTPRTRKPEAAAPEAPKPEAPPEKPADDAPASEPPNEPLFDREEAAPEQPAAPAPAPEQPSGFNPLKALRNLLKAGGFKESHMLDFWSTTGATDGSHSSLEEVMMALPLVVSSTVENFSPVADKLKELKAGAK
jgi:phage recombination protein Bet